jgi:hypothetical protein
MSDMLIIILLLALILIAVMAISKKAAIAVSGAIFLGAVGVGGFYAVKWLFIGGMMAVALISSQIEKAEAERAARAAAADRLEAIKAEEARARRIDEFIKAHPIPLRPTTPSR